MEQIMQHGSLPVKMMMKHREVLSGSLESLLHGEHSEKTHANLLNKKIQYVATVLDLWIRGEGLGCKPQHRDWPVWSGPALDEAGGLTATWVTVGRFGGDL